MRGGRSSKDVPEESRLDNIDDSLFITVEVIDVTATELSPGSEGPKSLMVLSMYVV